MANESGFAAHVRNRGEEAKAIRRKAGYRAPRRVVERTHSRLNRFRRMLVLPESRIATLHLAFGIIARPTGIGS